MNDYISRDVAINHILDLAERWVMLYGRWDSPCARDYADEIDRVPAADVAPVVRGTWVEESDRWNHWHCSECGHVVGAAGKLGGKFCENCGADMRGDADE